MKKRHLVLAWALVLLVTPFAIILYLTSNSVAFVSISGVASDQRVQVRTGSEWREAGSFLGKRMVVFRIRGDQAFSVRTEANGRISAASQGYGTTGSTYWVSVQVNENNGIEFDISQFP
jgi:cell division protein YceG involved in septum cleavage